MKRLILSLTAFVLLAVHAPAQDRARAICGPYLQNVTCDSFTVMWETDIDALAWVEVAPDSDEHWYNRKRQVFREAPREGLLPLGRLHKVRISGLQPGTSYRYRIMMKGLKEYKGAGNVSYTRESGSDVFRRNPFRLTTRRASYDTLRFCVMNDIHEKDSLLGVLLDARRANEDFVVFNGDMTSSLMSEDRIRECWLSAASSALNGSLPFYALRGNHEYRGRDAILWPSHFETPTGHPYYAFRYGPYFFIGLDSGEDKPDDDIEYSGLYDTLPYLQKEAEWLRGVVDSEEFRSAQTRIVFSHIPPESKGWQGNRNVCELFVPILNEAGIDLMICGHIHRYRFDEPGSGMSPAAFPVWVNANVERLEVTLAPGRSIELRSFSPDGSLTHEMTL